MILYNITIIVDETAHNDWLNWATAELIPEIMGTELFESNRTLRVLDSPNEGVTYCLQFIANELEKYNQYQTYFAEKIESRLPEDLANKSVSFTTVMEFVG